MKPKKRVRTVRSAKRRRSGLTPIGPKGAPLKDDLRWQIQQQSVPRSYAAGLAQRCDPMTASADERNDWVKSVMRLHRLGDLQDVRINKLEGRVARLETRVGMFGQLVQDARNLFNAALRWLGEESA